MIVFGETKRTECPVPTISTVFAGAASEPVAESPPLARTGPAITIAASAPTVATTAERRINFFKIFSFSAAADLRRRVSSVQ
jgi:hypothetical protein